MVDPLGGIDDGLRGDIREILLLFSCRVNTGHNHIISERQRLSELACEELGTREQMWLEQYADDGIRVTPTRRVEQSGDFGGVMRVIVHDGDLLLTSAHLEAAGCAEEASRGLRGGIGVHAQQRGGDDCGGRVAGVMDAWNLEADWNGVRFSGERGGHVDGEPFLTVACLLAF